MTNAEHILRRDDSLFLGHYPQTVQGERLPIEWRVLIVEDERVLVVSRYVLDVQPFHHDAVSVRWEDCSLRTWLNTTFVDTAFTPAEQAAVCVPESHEDPADAMLWELLGLETATADIADRVFLLSFDDVRLCYPSAQALFCHGATAQPTPYAALRQRESCWWLRSSMPNFPMAHIVSPADSVGASAICADNRQGVRPAMWLDYDACRALVHPV